MVKFLAVILALVSAKDAEIKRHVSIDAKGMRLMRQDDSLKDIEQHINTLKQAAAAVKPDLEGGVEDVDETQKELQRLLNESNAERSDAANMLKNEETLAQSKAYEPIPVDEHMDEKIFHVADEDKDGHLDEKEMGKLLDKGGITEKELDWRAHDKDKDGKLSKNEFLSASSAAEQATKPRSLSLLEEYVMHSGGPSTLLKLHDFKTYDLDGNGMLDHTEASKMMLSVGLRENAWLKFDLDGDGKLSEKEFLRDRAQLHEETMVSNPGVDDDASLFQQVDQDQDGYLDGKEIDDLFDRIPHLHGHSFDWDKFDYDKDGKLSQMEFIQAGPEVMQSLPRSNHDDEFEEVEHEEDDEYPEHEEADDEEFYPEQQHRRRN